MAMQTGTEEWEKDLIKYAILYGKIFGGSFYPSFGLLLCGHETLHQGLCQREGPPETYPECRKHFGKGRWGGDKGVVWTICSLCQLRFVRPWRVAQAQKRAGTKSVYCSNECQGRMMGKRYGWGSGHIAGVHHRRLTRPELEDLVIKLENEIERQQGVINAFSID